MCTNIVIAKISNKNDDNDDDDDVDDKQTSFSFSMCLCIRRKPFIRKCLSFFFFSPRSSRLILSDPFSKPTGRVDESETENDTSLSFVKAKY
jgi:hypothetical protein